ncbi:MAG: hypothetical protein GX550_08245 [Syntrophomonadaceae bacterium]|nr:hypothetical protein [Syntrophomonadaceae bacterium]
MEEPPRQEDNTGLEKLARRVEELAINMDKMRFAEYIQLLENPYRLLYVNFLAGLARGLGTAIGFTLLAAVLIYFLQRIIMLNIPLIGDFIADIVQIVQSQLSTR